METTIKKININFPLPNQDMENLTTNKTIKTKKEPKNREITNTKLWQISEEELQPDAQLSYIHQLVCDEIVDTNPCQVILKHITQKINGYKAQDIKKALYEQDKLVDIHYVLNTLEKAANICYYCKNPVKVLYKTVREQTQWSLDRIDNNIGHNKENVVIACLQCNVGRKTMHQGRYVFTKQLVIIKS